MLNATKNTFKTATNLYKKDLKIGCQIKKRFLLHNENAADGAKIEKITN